MEGDHQLNARRLGKIVMKHADAEELGLLVDKQCGCTAHHEAVEVPLNVRFVDDFLRIKRKKGSVCSNDTVSCFDRTVHSIFAMCLRRLGMHENPVKTMMDALQALEHHMRMAFGDSTDFYTCSEDAPPHGLAQECGAAPTDWASVSSPLVEMTRKEGFGPDS